MLAAEVILTERKSEFLEIPVENLEPSPYQPRSTFSEEGIATLAKTFRHMGILEPLCVRRKPNDPNRFELIAGERRYVLLKVLV